ncbi:WD40 repeat-like protein [Linderina pennispora]|uniref:WD40 repeat-like protein n=1 Tax=Linderina pennispora TaxID=61395 RepID=A0A1Y1WEY3_9FUNG|nr:WD40 repeat-like protein [Linderina pennispora]ORX72101.1 WD40 repeat-like protein [Linderina pennispora]
MSTGSPYYPIAGLTPDALSPRKEICNYFSNYPLYSLAWSRREDRNRMFRMALGTFLEESTNKLQQTTRPDFGLIAEAAVDYPVTKILWHPVKTGYSSDLLATTGDMLADLGLRAKLTTRADYAAPITSFDWNSIDPTAHYYLELWDIETNQAKTQLIAHDREVFDVGFVAGSQDVFASAGADGSIRMFDLRSLEHSTILFEAPSTTAQSAADPSNYSSTARITSFTPPLLRLSCNAVDPNYIATFALDAHQVSILDVRFPGSPVIQLIGHQAPIHSVAWNPGSSSQLCSAGADSRVLPTNAAPSLTYAARLPVNSLAWHQNSAEWVSIAFGNTVQTLRL